MPEEYLPLLPLLVKQHNTHDWWPDRKWSITKSLAPSPKGTPPRPLSQPTTIPMAKQIISISDQEVSIDWINQTPIKTLSVQTEFLLDHYPYKSLEEISIKVNMITDEAEGYYDGARLDLSLFAGMISYKTPPLDLSKEIIMDLYHYHYYEKWPGFPTKRIR